MTISDERHFFHNGIWVETAHLYLQKLPLIVLMVVGFTALGAYDQIGGHSSGSSVSTVVWAFLAISVHASILNGSQSVFPQSRGVFGPFLWRSIVLAIPGVVVSLATLITLDITSNLTILIILPVYGLITTLVLSVAGTWLPAVVAEGGDRRLSVALTRGKRVFGYTLARLIVGCGATFTIAFGLFLILMTSASEIGLSKMKVGDISPFELAASAILYLSLAFVFVMLPVVLSRAYLIAENPKSKTFEAAS
jgi:hypothetical protein